ncbi:MAG: aromatic ring-hydroxylating dioxygenase subunit alpha [Anaerolineaceae bacterium]|nr:aromatic ring-hydroxylating dioxygenase subunit alpha [Anaerolineaceae bacterium]
MIRNQWYAVLESREVKKGKMIGVKRMGERLLFWRKKDGTIACLKDQCPHRGVQLSIGKIVDEHIQCPFHGLEFDETGACQYVPSLGKAAESTEKYNANTYPVREAHGFIYIFWGDAKAGEPLPDILWFDSIPDGEFSSATIVDHWPVHYSRVLENQLDVAHLWLVHRTTIGRGNKRVVDGPASEWCCEFDDEKKLLNLWVTNRVDDGKTVGLRPNQVEKPDRRPSTQLLMPNVWHNWIADDIRVVVAFVPVDDENARAYFRFYQRIVKTPVLRELMLYSGLIGNWVIERQDRRVVKTELPKRSDLRIGEKLMPADYPILLYRRKRAEMIKAAESESRERPNILDWVG